MNDIEVLEELIKNEHGELLNCWDYGEEAKQAIENLLKEIQSDKERIKDLEEEGDLYRSQVNSAFDRGFIHISLIKEKIEELKKQEKEELKGMKGQDRYFVKQIYQYKIQVLEELLKGE